MFKALLFAAATGLVSTAFADGPGSRIRIGPPDAQRPGPAANRDLERCQSLHGEARDRCLKEARAAAAADEKTRGPEAVGGTPAGTGATAGTSGGGTFGGSAPR